MVTILGPMGTVIATAITLGGAATFLTGLLRRFVPLPRGTGRAR